MKYWKKLRNQRGAWLFAVGLALLLWAEQRMISSFGRQAIVPVICIAAALCMMTVSFGFEMRRNIGRRRELENMLADGDTDYLEPAEKERLLQMDDREMVEQVFDKLHEVSISRALKTEAELHALQNQINPHFLYNTLEIIRSRAMRRGSEDVAEMAEALGMLFRYCINSPGELATLAQELDNVHHYLLIQRYRYGDRFTYEEHIEDEEAMGSSLPVMTLQPLVENALSHGINRRANGGKIAMRIETVGNRLMISVEDNGVGIEENELRRVRKALRERSGPIERRADSSRSTGIALRNVNRRIQFYFGMQYGVDIASTEGIGTTVTVTLPQMKGN